MLHFKTNEGGVELLEANGLTIEILADFGVLTNVLLSRLAKDEKDFNRLKELTLDMLTDCVKFETL